MTDLVAIAKRMAVCQRPISRDRVSSSCRNDSQPIVICKDSEIHHFKANYIPMSEIVDTNGAGDAFTGAFLEPIHV